MRIIQASNLLLQVDYSSSKFHTFYMTSTRLPSSSKGVLSGDRCELQVLSAVEKLAGDLRGPPYLANHSMYNTEVLESCEVW